MLLITQRASALFFIQYDSFCYCFRRMSQLILTIDMSTTIKPIGMRVLLERVKVEQKTTSGLYVPDNAQLDGAGPKKAKVVALGTGKKGEEFRVAVGDTVLITNYGGVEYKDEDKKYIIINEVDILAILND